jgi:hypothetical protein
MLDGWGIPKIIGSHVISRMPQPKGVAWCKVCLIKTHETFNENPTKKHLKIDEKTYSPMKHRNSHLSRRILHFIKPIHCSVKKLAKSLQLQTFFL